MKKHLFLTFAALFSFCMGAWASDWGDGACGGATWKLTETGILTIRATTIAGFEDGVIVDYDDSNKAPWYDDRASIKKIILENIKQIGQMAFYNLPNLTSVTSSSSLTTIGKCAFQNCTSLETIDLSAATSLTIIDYWAFGNCNKLSSVKLGSVK